MFNGMIFADKSQFVMDVSSMDASWGIAPFQEIRQMFKTPRCGRRARELRYAMTCLRNTPAE
jgi:hypothetical protein